MKHFRVTWHPDARSELARIWLDAADRDAVTDAANRIDAALQVDPERVGEEFYGDRIFVELPLDSLGQKTCCQCVKFWNQIGNTNLH